MKNARKCLNFMLKIQIRAGYHTVMQWGGFWEGLQKKIIITVLFLRWAPPHALEWSSRGGGEVILEIDPLSRQIIPRISFSLAPRLFFGHLKTGGFLEATHKHLSSIPGHYTQHDTAFLELRLSNYCLLFLAAREIAKLVRIFPLLSNKATLQLKNKNYHKTIC